MGPLPLCLPLKLPFPTFAISPNLRPPLRFNLRNSQRASASPARDRVIDFGKYKGRMLGSLPSGYLKWVSTNLRAGDTEEWARLADRVLADPVYCDRIEWEAAENILSGNAATSSGGSAVAELLEISERFGWDNEDKIGWSKVDFGLLGTSRGGRIPRAAARVDLNKQEEEEEVRRIESGEGGRRGERRDRVRARRLRKKTSSEGTMVEDKDTSSPAAGGVGNGCPFPGREALFKKVLNPEY
ncbi:hypothetical protein SASPL_109941 [Salvia splendens]|uniref:Uncharacterized protein n=2 Tax=Salvia splendens TaxID=180675 RepID=A0A8X8Y7Z4_SALSN|nr:hypothetical protein SASPL_109941 [Salvia splendens]